MLITVPEVRKLMGTQPADDESLQDQRDAVVELWEDMTCRLWERRVSRVYRTKAISERTIIIWLPLWPIESITKIEKVKSDGTLETLLAARYHVEGDNKVIYECGPWAQFNEVIVTFTGGYTKDATGIQTERPAFVTRALRTQLRFERERLANERIITKSQNFEGGSGVFEKAFLHPTFEGLAKRHKHKRPG